MVGWMDIPSFGLEDLSEDYNLRLSDELVEAIDKMNRPWLYDKSDKKKGRNKLWRADSKMFKRLWGFSRFQRRKGLEGYDNGAFIRRVDVQELIDRTNLPYWMIETNVIGFRRGGSGRELRARLPLSPNKWWAKLLGFYWSSGTYLIRKRKNNVEIHIRISVDDNVVPMLEEIGKHTGEDPHPKGYVPIYKGPHNTHSLGSRVRPSILFSAPTFEVLKKFGINIEPDSDFEGHTKSRAARYLRPYVPEWVSQSEEFSHAFIEGYVNGHKGQSMMNVISGNRGISTQVLIRFYGYPEETVKVFAQFFKDWFARHGINGYFRKMPDCRDDANRLPRYELIIHSIKELTIFWKTFDIRRPDMRARLFLRINLETDYPIYQAIRCLRSAQMVALGLIYEKPRTYQDLHLLLRMRPERVNETIQSLIERGFIIFEKEYYHVDLTAFKTKLREKSVETVERIKEQVNSLSDTLFFQCLECGEVSSEKGVCENCGSKTEPMSRRKYLQPLVLSMTREQSKIKKLE